MNDKSPSPLERLHRLLGARYVVDREIGRGAAAIVYLAHDSERGCAVAVKVLRAEFAAAVSATRFLLEIEIGQTLDHPNIVPIHDFASVDGELWYTMPYIDGPTLRGRLRAEKQLALDDAIEITRQVASALDYAHARGVIHRDIKPGNILMSGNRAVVSDFGIARAINVAPGERLTHSDRAIGTPEYMSPEQASAQRELDGRSDVYGLACVLYEMLAGEPPFTGATPQAVIARHFHEAPRSIRIIRPAIPAGVERAIERALAKVPADRFATSGAFVQALDRGMNEPAATAARSGKRWIPIAATLVIAAGALIATKIAGRSRAPLDLERARIAVLNFEAPPADSELAEIGRGLARDLTDELRRARSLEPLAYDAVRTIPYNSPLDSLSKSLNVQTFVTGYVERLGDSIRVRAHIIDPATNLDKVPGAIRAQYARADVPRLRDTIVEQVGMALLKAFGGEEQLREWRTGARSAQAWQLRERAEGKMAFARGLPRQSNDFAPQLAALRLADSLLEQSARLDPDWTEPDIARGWLRYQRSLYVSSGAEARELDSAITLASAVLRRAPNDPRAHELRGTIRLSRWLVVDDSPPTLGDSAKTDLRAALAVEPSLGRAWYALSVLLDVQGDTAGASDAARRAQESDVYFTDMSRTSVRLVFRQLFDGHGDSARAVCAHARTALPNDAYVRTCALSVLGWVGRGTNDVNEAWRELAWTERSGPFASSAGMYVAGRFFVAAVLARSGMRDSARVVYDTTRARLDRAGFASAFQLNAAQVLTLLGEYDAAIDLLQALAKTGPAALAEIRRLPWFDPIRTQPRFNALFVHR